MILKKLKIHCFKLFEARTFEFNDDINIIVGDNDSGKTTLLEAIELCFNGTYRGRPLRERLSTALFTKSSVDAYLSSDRGEDKLPELSLEAFLEGNPQLRGNCNSEKADTQGITLKVSFDTDYRASYQEFITGPVTTLPVELYRVDWTTFAQERVSRYKNYVNCLFVDPVRLHPSHGRTKYIGRVINATLEKESRSKLNLSFRQLQSRFDEQEDVKVINTKLDTDNLICDKALKITADTSSTNTWENSLGLLVDGVPLGESGKGEQSQIQIKMALSNSGKAPHITMFEEPENHLSHMRLVKLIKYIEDNSLNRQVFLTTHSSYVLNKLSLGKLCLLADGKYRKLDALNVNTAKTLPISIKVVAASTFLIS